MQFQSERLMFRELTQKDFKQVYAIFSNKEIMKYALLDAYTGEEDFLPYFNQILENNTLSQTRRAYEFGIFSLQDGHFAGFGDIEIHRRGAYGGSGEIGYFLARDAWGRGYATETARALVNYSFNQLKLHRVTARCNALNSRSERVMQKAGMHKEGELRKERFKNGRWENELCYAVLFEEWKEARPVQGEGQWIT